MSHRIDLLRLDYIFSVIVPLLIAIFLNNYLIWNHIDIIVGFAMLAITGNTWNDVVDMRHPEEVETIERVEGYHWKEIFTIGLVSFILGIALLSRACFTSLINAILLFVIILMVLVYLKFKSVPIANHILLGTSHIVLPYFLMKIDYITRFAPTDPLMTEIEWLMMIVFFSFALTGQFVHEAIDGDSITRFSLKGQQIVIIISACITVVIAIIMYILFFQFAFVIYFMPFILFPLGTIYTFRRPTMSTKGVKDVGILMGNFLLVYFLTLIIMQMSGTLVVNIP